MTIEAQKLAILHHLQEHHEGITAMEALRRFGCARAAARIWDLRDAGYNIRTAMEHEYNEKGKVVKSWARYYMEGQNAVD